VKGDHLKTNSTQADRLGASHNTIQHTSLIQQLVATAQAVIQYNTLKTYVARIYKNFLGR